MSILGWLRHRVRDKRTDPAASRTRAPSAINYEAEYRRYREKGLRALAQKGISEAIEALGRAALFHANDPEAHFALGRAFVLAGKIEAARQAFLRALNLNPNAPEVRRALLALPPLAQGRAELRIDQLLQVPELRSCFFVLEAKKGGFGVVYIVEDCLSHERSAFKTFQSSYLWSDEDRKRFEREAVNWIMLDRHPNIVSAQTLIVIEGFPCLWLEYLPHNLADLLQAGPLSPKSALELSFQFCDGMFYACRKLGLIHRDIKPSNCLLTEDARTLKIADLGLSRTFAEIGEKSLELSGLNPEIGSQFTSVAGTPQYMAPEQFQIGADLDTRTDIHSFGVMLYQMLTKDLPPIGYLAFAHITNWSAPPAIPNKLKRVILRCVHPNPHARPADFRELRHTLQAVYCELTGVPVPPEAKPVQMTFADWSDKGVSLDHLGYLKEACVCYERAVGISPDQAIIWMNYSGVLLASGRLDEALACADRGLQIDSSEPGLWKNKKLILESMNRPVEARACLERLLELQYNTGSSFALRDFAITLYNDGDLESALRCCDAGLASNPRDAVLWFGRALVLTRLEQYEQALASCKDGLSIEPRNYELWSAQADVLRNLGRLEEALLACDRGLEVKPEDGHLWNSKAFVLLGLRRFEQAVLTCKEGLAIEPRNHDFWSIQADALRNLGRFEEALAACNQGLKINPSDSTLLENKGLTLSSLGKSEEGEKYLRIAQVIKD
ncbi:MAG: tetratricopeptide repeat protein [Candidatus Acidiferrum sp.]